MGTVTITTPATSYDLVSIADVREELGVTDTSQDSKLERWLRAASARFISACGINFVPEVVSETFRMQDRFLHHGHLHQSMLELTRTPVLSVTTVTVDDGVLDATEYELDGELLKHLSGDRLVPWRGSKIVVAYESGYRPIPYDVQDAIMTMLRYRWSLGSNNPLLRSFSIDGVGSETYWAPGTSAGGLSAELQPVADVIQRYQRLILV